MANRPKAATGRRGETEKERKPTAVVIDAWISAGVSWSTVSSTLATASSSGRSRRSRAYQRKTWTWLAAPTAVSSTGSITVVR